MALWLKAEKRFSVPQVNNLPTVYSAISIVFMLGSGAYNDWRGSQMESLLLICATMIISTAILTAWEVSEGAKFFAFYIAGTIQSMFPILVSWAHKLCTADAEERAIVIGSMNSIGLAQGTWWNQIFVPTVEAPRFCRGYRAGLAASLALTAWVPVVWGFGRMQDKAEKRNAPPVTGEFEPDLNEAETGSVPHVVVGEKRPADLSVLGSGEKVAGAGIVM